MKRFQNIMHTWMFAGMDLAEICRQIRGCGFDGLDLSISNDESYSVLNYKASHIRELADDYQLTIPAASALMKGPIHDLSESDAKMRNIAVDFVKRAIDAASFAGVHYMLVMPSRIGNTTYHISRKADWAQTVESLRICALHARAQGVSLMLEPLNRNRVTMVRTMQEGVDMIRDVGTDNVYLVPDIYQLSMEEISGISGSIRRYGSYIKNIHVADSTRHVPGMGVYNWSEILEALSDIDYPGALSFEPVFLDFDAKRVETEEKYQAMFLDELKRGVAYTNAKMDAMTSLSLS